MAKLIMVVSLIVSIGAIFGVLGYHLTKQTSTNYPPTSPFPKTVSVIEISTDKKSILNAETKAVIFTIDDANKYLKDSGYAYNPDTFQTTNAKYVGDCFLGASLSNNIDRIVFSTGCLPGDLPQAWVGTVKIQYVSGFGYPNESSYLSDIKFLIGGGGKNFVWSSDDKTITYEADLGLSGMTETRTIDAGTGKILERESVPDETADWKTYRNEEFGFEVKYPVNFIAKEINKGENISRGIVVNSEILKGSIFVKMFAADEKKSMEECIANSENISAEQQHFISKDLKMINSVTFYHLTNYPELIGAYCGMSSGCWYQDIYRTFHDGNCYELKYERSDREFIEGNPYGKYETIGDVTEVPKIFDQILSAFKFIK